MKCARASEAAAAQLPSFERLDGAPGAKRSLSRAGLPFASALRWLASVRVGLEGTGKFKKRTVRDADNGGFDVVTCG